jgi:2,4-dienoyl-CoA reductase-like NADH-dependent reductase (Old Yellow Enzyme family)
MKTLFDESKIGSMHLKNRFIRAAIGDLAVGGHLTEEMLETYKELASGGVGTIITGLTLVDEVEGSFPLPAMYEDIYIDEYKRLVDSVHDFNTNIILQLVYVGTHIMGDPGERDILAPSAVANKNTGVVPKEMTVNEIKSIQSKFAHAAVRAKKAGFDGIEIHAAHGFLLNQFITPFYNRRKDLYGGSIENRARIILETYSAVREAVGIDYPVLVKVNCMDGIENGLSEGDFRYVCAELSKLGVDAIEVSGNWLERSKEKDTYFKNEAEVVAKENQVAVIVTGGNRNYSDMEKLLNSTNIEYFGMARPFIAEPDLVKNYSHGHPQRTKCVSCNSCLSFDGDLSCILNRSVR